MILNGCKKTDKFSSQTDQSVIDQIKMKLRNQSFKTTQILNLPGKGFYGDENGNNGKKITVMSVMLIIIIALIPIMATTIIFLMIFILKQPNLHAQPDIV